MDCLLAPHVQYAMTYIDNIIIFTKTWLQHLQALWAILTELRKMGMMVNPRKRALGKREMKYFRFQVRQGVIRPLVDKKKAI